MAVGEVSRLQDGSTLSLRQRARNRLIATSLVGLLVTLLASISIGATGVSVTSLPSATWHRLFGGNDLNAAREALVLFELRLPRTLLAAFVGAALAVSGALMQGLFRNPLADPGLVGVSSGAALAAITTIAFGNEFAKPWMDTFGVYGLPVAAFLGGLVTTLILVAVAGRHGRLMMGTLLLAGIALGALAGALSGLIAYASDDRELRDLTLWSMGSLTGSSWPKVLAILPFAALIAVAIPHLVRGLNGFLLGEAEAFHMGIDVERTKWIIILTTAACVGAAVAVAGVIGFVGIVVPHIVRLVAGPDHNVVLPASAILGACLVLLADVFARVVVAPSELPIGIILAAIGAPIFLHLVLRRGVGGME